MSLPPGATLVSGTVPDQSSMLPPGATLVSGQLPVETPLIPDPIEQARAGISKTIPKALIPGTVIADPTGGKMAIAQSGKDPAYNDYMRESGKVAGMTAGGMTASVFGATGVLAKSLAAGAGTGVGELAGGGTPTESAETAGLTTAGGLLFGGLSAGARNLLKSG